MSLAIVLPASRASAAPCDTPIVNEIACENTKVGNLSSEWQITGSGSASIQGFATDISVNRGSTIGFKVKTTASSYRLDIYRMGYYGGRGARKITTVNPTSYPTQPTSCLSNSTGLVDCGNWAQTASWAVPADAVSGIYFAKLVAGTAASHIMFIVRNDASTSDLFFQTSDTTWQAYNDYGGNSLYEGSPAGRAYKVSYNRPFDTN
ncbi:MAG: N,N-dimethylformamidase beta subunit family domain-containing protein, partial [Propionibacteriaceae bacterium]